MVVELNGVMVNDVVLKKDEVPLRVIEIVVIKVRVVELVVVEVMVEVVV